MPIASLTPDQREELAEKNQERQLDLTKEATNPFYVVLVARRQASSARHRRLQRASAVFLDFLEPGLWRKPSGG